MKKISMICLALVLALGALGVGYASWNDTITIDGTVTTGTLDLSVDGYSGTWVYKIVSTGGFVRSTVELDLELAQYEDYTLVAYAKAEKDPAGTDQDVLVTFDNLFPCVIFEADFDVHFDGSIPANIQVDDLVVTGIPAAWVTITGFPDPDPDDYFQQDGDNDWHVIISIHVPQPADGQTGQGITDGTITGRIYAQQWNEALP